MFIAAILPLSFLPGLLLTMKRRGMTMKVPTAVVQRLSDCITERSDVGDCHGPTVQAHSHREERSRQRE